MVVAVLAAFALIAGCGGDDELGRTVDSIVEGDVPPGTEVELETRIVSAVTGANDPTFEFFVRGSDDRIDPLLVVGVQDMDDADTGDVVRITGTVEEAPTQPNDVVVVADELALVEEGSLDEGQFEEQTDPPDVTEPERDDPVVEDPDSPLEGDSDIPSGGEGPPQDPAGEAGGGVEPDTPDRTDSGAEPEE